MKATGMYGGSLQEGSQDTLGQQVLEVINAVLGHEYHWLEWRVVLDNYLRKSRYMISTEHNRRLTKPRLSTLARMLLIHRRFLPSFFFSTLSIFLFLPYPSSLSSWSPSSFLSYSSYVLLLITVVTMSPVYKALLPTAYF